ncbi:hypothetical protein RCH18_002544 [Flavobacterium sp. PL11]|nr:hypothetical protein [Flavobacterium sp. PL11]
MQSYHFDLFFYNNSLEVYVKDFVLLNKSEIDNLVS